MFKAFKEKTAELKDKAKQRMSMANEQGRRLRENVEVMTGVDKARERFAQARNPIGGSSTAARAGKTESRGNAARRNLHWRTTEKTRNASDRDGTHHDRKRAELRRARGATAKTAG